MNNDCIYKQHRRFNTSATMTPTKSRKRPKIRRSNFRM